MTKSLIKKIAGLTLASLAMVVLVGVSAQTASAGWNDAGAGDCQTFSLANVTTGQGYATPCWTATNISAKTGDAINVKIYFHNTGTTAVNNATVSFTNPGTAPVSGSQSFGAALKIGGSTVASGNGTVTITSGAVKFRLSRVTIQRQSTNGTIETVQNPQDIFTQNGVSLGTVAPGWSGQGVIKAVFVLDDAGTPPCTNCGNIGQAPTVTTNAAMPITMVGNLGNATLNGSFNSNGAETITSFRYRLVGSSNWITVDMQNRGITSGNLQYVVTGLGSGNYEFEAVATNQYETRYGGIMNFTIGNGNTCNTCGCAGYPNCSTACNSGYQWNGSYCVPVTPTCGYNQTWNGSYCVTNTTCGYNQYWNGSYCVTNIQNCSYNQTWNGYQCVNNSPTVGAPIVSTLGAVSTGGAVALVDGYYTANGCNAYTYFNYGTTQALGYVTPEIARYAGSGSMTQSITGLTPNTTYYYQAAVRNCQSTSVGEIRAFTTARVTTNDTTITNIVNTTTTTGLGGNSFIKLMIDNRRATVSGGRDISYDVSWENITNRTLKNLIIEVNFPTQMTIVDTDHGLIERNEHSVVYQIDTLGPRETGSMVVVTRVNSGLREGDPVVAQAIAAFENPRTGTAENAIAYDADTFSTNNSVLGASIFGLDFLPNSLAGWLLILLIIILIIIAAHAYATRRKQGTMIMNNNTPRPNDPVAGPQTGNDYVVYRPGPPRQ